MKMDSFADWVRARLAAPLPGVSAQYRMASLGRYQHPSSLNPGPEVREASVLNLLHWRDGAWRTVLIQRATNPRDRHSGQISFPGGRLEEGDASLACVALREAEEEIGINASDIRILGRLTQLYIPVSNYLVHPFVAMLDGPPSFRPQPGEVAQILSPEIDAFRSSDHPKYANVPVYDGFLLKDVPCYEVDGQIVWGATAMIISEFLEALYGRDTTL
jgi:8-oxo-dGTP pyrophosphatase MutT (NUDIX family)